ncbi:MAG: DnaJ family domain-containing protein [Chloroflexota bacterium]
MADDMSLSPIEQAIRQAMRDGLFDSLPGAGKPLNLSGEDDANTPNDMRLAYKIMKDNDIAPEWMMLSDILEQQQKKIHYELQRGLRAYRGALHDAERDGDLGRRHRANRTWERLLGTFEEVVAQYNQNILTYNIKVPTMIAKRPYMDLQKEIERLQNSS